MKKKDTASQGASEWGSVPAARITPSDVQEKEFQVARFGAGYRMRDVDEFLDQVTDTLSALMAENERLLRGAGDAAPTGSPPMQPADDAERAAVDAFLRREKGFLQDLGGLVQAHAEELRSMIRSARRDETAPTADVAPREEPRVEAPPPAALVVPEARTEPDAPSAPAASETDVMEEPPPPPTSEVADEERTAEDPPPDPTETVTDEPIRLEEPEPARSSRRDEDEEGSLRELFWGEE
jgi:DivIVA domain-containing protein